jgi:cell division transport system permease protein
LEEKTAYRRKPSYMPSIISVGLVLFMLGLFGLIIISGNRLSQHIRENIKLNVFIKEDVSQEEIIRLQKNLEAEAFAKSVVYISKDEAARIFSEELGHDFVSFIGYNPLLPSLELRIKSDYANSRRVEDIEKELMRNPLVQEVSWQKNLVEQVNSNLRNIATLVLAMSAIFFIIAITLINNTIRLNLYARRFLIKSMQLVGATRWFIIRPFMWRSVLHGIYGTFIAAVLLAGLLYFLPQRFSELNLLSLYDYQQFAVLFLVLLCIGVLISLLSSMIATRRYLRLKLDELY